MLLFCVFNGRNKKRKCEDNTPAGRSVAMGWQRVSFIMTPVPVETDRENTDNSEQV
jgi:hypothetical protein